MAYARIATPETSKVAASMLPAPSIPCVRISKE